jgi:hypothetical protein
MKMEPICAEQHQIAKFIHDHVCRFPDNDSGNEQLLRTIYDYMDGFKLILDSSDKLQLNWLCSQYPGFYRFSRILEIMAEGVADGTIEVPKDH